MLFILCTCLVVVVVVLAEWARNLLISLLGGVSSVNLGITLKKKVEPNGNIKHVFGLHTYTLR